MKAVGKVEGIVVTGFDRDLRNAETGQAQQLTGVPHPLLLEKLLG